MCFTLVSHAAQRIGAQLRAPLTGYGSPPCPIASRLEPPRERSEQRAAMPETPLPALASCSALLGGLRFTETTGRISRCRWLGAISLAVLVTWAAIPALPWRTGISAVYFQKGGDELSADAKLTLRVEWARFLLNRPGWLQGPSTVQGHADEEGDKELMLELSRRRAERVMRALIELGVDREMLKIEALGDSAPAVEEPGEAMAQWNRRVEFYHPIAR